MRPLLDETHDPGRTSFIPAANLPGADFPIQNLPLGVFRRGNGSPGRVGMAIGDQVLDLSAAASLFHGAAREAAERCAHDRLNALMELGPLAWSDLRRQASALLSRDADVARVTPHLVPQRAVDMLRPVKVASFTDFYASVHHATNAGRLFRPDAPLLPNYKYVPIAYSGRAATVRVSGLPVQRPHGQIKLPDSEPLYAPTRQLDYEVELGMFVGRPSEPGQPVSVQEAGGHLFGFCIVNDWSARDLQAWEYQPLGPFTSKTFCTTISPWVVTADALRPFRTAAFDRPQGDPAPLPHLFDIDDQACGAVDVIFEASLSSPKMRESGMAGLRLSAANASLLYWTPAQMIAHLTSNGCPLEVGDLLGSGTISGDGPATCGSLLEITKRGATPLRLPTGEERGFLEDGDEVVISGRCQRDGFVSIGFGECVGRVTAAREAAGLPASRL